MSGDIAVAMPTRLLSLTWQVSHGTILDGLNFSTKFREGVTNELSDGLGRIGTG